MRILLILLALLLFAPDAEAGRRRQRRKARRVRRRHHVALVVPAPVFLLPLAPPLEGEVMAQFRSKPKVVEAEQWFPGKKVAGVFPGLEGEYGPYVITIHRQRALLTPGDWIITEPDGVHHYPCKPDIFEASYESVEER